MVSAFMPDVVVEIAFDSGYNTPAASRTWTDVSAYVELHHGIDIDFGRQDERSTADANSLTLTLDNTDGRFTAGRSGSPYYPNVKLGRPIRVKVTPPSGSTVTRFTGFIDEWPVEWDGSDAYAKATVRASSRLARLGLTAKLRSMIEEEILNRTPVAYYTLGSPSGSTTADDSSGHSAPQLATTGDGAEVVFGNATGPGTDELTAATFASGQYLRAPDVHATPSAISYHFTIKVDALPADEAVLVGEDLVDNTGAPTYPTQALVRLDSSGVLALWSTVTSSSVNDGGTHSVVAAINLSTGVGSLFLDGISQGSTPAGALTTPPSALQVGSASFSGVVSHVAAFESVLSLTDAVDIYEAIQGTTATTDERLERILDWAGVASTEITTDTGSETMTYQKTTGQSVVDALRDVESTEGGVLFDDRDGNVRFRNRSHRYLATAAATLNMASQHVGADYSPKLDRSTLVNDVTVSNPTTEESARSTDATSSDEYGIATSTATSVADTYEPLQQKASWLVASYAEPRSRVPSLTVDVLAHQGLTPSAQTLLGLTVGDLLAVTNAPTQADTTTPFYFVEGYTERIGPESYEITFNLSPTYPTLSTLVLNSATRGLLDTNLLAL